MVALSVLMIKTVRPVGGRRYRMRLTHCSYRLVVTANRGLLWGNTHTAAMTDEIDVPTEPRAAVDALADHLIATGDRPVPPSTNRWLGEAEAVARDAAVAGVDDHVRRKRVQQAADLLQSAGDTGDEHADRRIEAAIECCQVVLDTDSV